MGQCKLSDRQKNLLRAISDGLRARGDEHGQIWVRMTHDTGQPVWQNVPDQALVARLVELMKLGDLVTFETCGFIENPEPGRYYLVEQRILTAVEQDFYESGVIPAPRKKQDGNRRRSKRGSRGGSRRDKKS